MFTLIANIGQNRELGNHGDLCFHLKDDLKFFKQTTSGHPVVMGRKTWDSLPKKLPNRQNIVISRRPEKIAPKHPTSTPKPSKSPQNAPETQISSLDTPEKAASRPTLADDTPDLIISDPENFIFEHENDPENFFVIGGAEIYQIFLPHAAKLYLTSVSASAPEADVYFPDFDPALYQRKIIKKGTENGLAYIISSYTKL